MNLRPPGPQPGALPDCATPRDPPHPTARQRFSVRQPSEHVFVVELRRCCRCKQSKPLDEFSMRRRATGQRDTHCKPCRSAYGKEHYAANRQRYIQQSAARKAQLTQERVSYLMAYFEDHPCVDCGERDPVVLEFDHTGADKEFDIGAKLIHVRWQLILDEIAKCEVVCSNCHRRRTARRRRSRRWLWTTGEAGDRA